MYPIIARIGPVAIHSWGLMVSLAVLVGVLVARHDADRAGITREDVIDLALYLAVGGFIGARLMFVALEPSLFLRDPAQIVMLTMGGVSIHGALIGGALAGLIFARMKKASFAKLADLVAAPLLLGQAIGRIGCFLGGDSYGKITGVPWAVHFPGVAGLRHPTQLYEAAIALAGFALLWSLRKRNWPAGQLFLVYLVTYSVIRFFVEIFRDSEYLIAQLSYAQVASIAIVLVAGVLIWLRSRTPSAPQLAARR